MDQAPKPSFLYGRFCVSNEVPRVVRWLLKHNIVRTTKEANGVLLLIAVAAFSLSMVLASDMLEKPQLDIRAGYSQIEYDL